MRDKIDVVVDGLIINPEGKMFLVNLTNGMISI